MNHFTKITLFLLLCSPSWAQKKETPKSTSTAHSSGESWRFGIGLSQTSSNAMNFNSTYLGGSTQKTLVAPTYDGSPMIEFDLRFLDKNAWGPIASVMIEFEHRFNSITYNGIANTGSNVFNGSKYTLYTLNAGTAYRWSQYYMPFEFNYSIIDFTAAPNFSGSATMKGGNSVNVGVGYYSTDKLVAEFLILKTTTVKFYTNSSSGVYDDYGLAYIFAISAGLKYFF